MTDNNLQEDQSEKHISKLEPNEWTVLVVDDQRDNLLIAREALQFHGATVSTASNGAEGIEALQSIKPTLILLDLSMPEMSGWEMFAQVRANPETADIPVIALTAHVMAGDEVQVMDAGFDGYIPKPFSVATIVYQIQSILAKINNKDNE